MRYRLLLIVTLLLLVAVPAAAQQPPPQPQPQPTLPPDILLLQPGGCDEVFDLREGDIATMRGGVYVRANPNINAGIVAYAPQNISVRVLSSQPVCANNFLWWFVERRFEEPTFEGWVAQNSAVKQFLFPPERPEEVCPPPLAIQVGQAVEIFSGVLVRSAPVIDAPVITNASAGLTARITGASVCGSGYRWWPLEVTVANILYSGWVVQSLPSGNVIGTELLNIAPAADEDPNNIACGPAAPLAIGGRARLRFTGETLKALRVQPSQFAEIINTLPSGVQVEILRGPVCFRGINFWYVRVFGGSVSPEGWLAEGDHLGRFLAPGPTDYGPPAR